MRSVTKPDAPFAIGVARLLRDGSDIALVSTGAQTIRALEAAELLEDKNISAAVLHVPTIKPLDTSAILAIARNVPLILTCEEHSIYGGLGGAVAELLADSLPTRIARSGIADVDGESGPNDALLIKYSLTPAAISEKALTMLART